LNYIFLLVYEIYGLFLSIIEPNWVINNLVAV